MGRSSPVLMLYWTRLVRVRSSFLAAKMLVNCSRRSQLTSLARLQPLTAPLAQIFDDLSGLSCRWWFRHAGLWQRCRFSIWQLMSMKVAAGILFAGLSGDKVVFVLADDGGVKTLWTGVEVTSSEQLVT